MVSQGRIDNDGKNMPESKSINFNDDTTEK